MGLTVVTALDSIRGYALTVSLVAFVMVNGVAVAMLLGSRSRALVQRWTSPWLATNLLLLGVGAGVPLLAGICKSVVEVVAPALAVTTPPSALD